MIKAGRKTDTNNYTTGRKTDTNTCEKSLIGSMTKHFNSTYSKSNKTYFFSYSSPKETHSDAKGPPSLCFLPKNPFTSLIFTRIIQFDF